LTYPLAISGYFTFKYLKSLAKAAGGFVEDITGSEAAGKVVKKTVKSGSVKKGIKKGIKEAKEEIKDKAIDSIEDL